MVPSMRHVPLLAALLATALAAGGCGANERGAARTTTPAKEPPSQHYRSRPDLRPPPVRVLTSANGAAPGYLFVAPKKQVAQAGPLILDSNGQVVWFRPLDTKGVTDFRVQRYRGRPVLTWWRGETDKGVGNGRYVVTDRSYRVIANVRAGHGLAGDIHEFLLTPRDTALITIYRSVRRDLTAVGGPKDGAIKEGVVQEVDVATGKVLFEWHSDPWIGLAESYEPVPKDGSEWDYFHLNAIDVDADGDLLVSARHTHAVYKISRKDGSVVWRLGGKQSDFALGPGVRFAWQHDARRQPDGTLTLFDNAASRPREGAASRVLVLRLDERAHRATLVRSYEHRPPLLSTSQGNAQFLPGGHVLVGWGSNPYLTELAADGRTLLDLRFGAGKVDSYRAYRFAWEGAPADRPAVAAGGGALFVSWNGATRVTRWRALAGDVPVATVAKGGFETRIPVARGRTYAVQALDPGGRVLAVSRAVRVG
jgi:hypothetical protein